MHGDRMPKPDTAARCGTDEVRPRRWNVEQTPDIPGVVFWVWHVKERVLCLSREFDRMLQADIPDGRRVGAEWWRSRVHEEDLPDMERVERDILADRITSYDIVFRIRSMDNCWIWCNSKGQVTEREDGKPTVACGVMTRISKLRSDAKFQQGGVGAGDINYHAMLENSPDMYVRMDREMFPLYINPVVARYMGRERDAYSYNDSLEELKMDPAQLAFLERNVRRVFEEGMTIREMVTFRIFDGTEVTGEYSFWPEYDANGRVMTAMTHFRDLTEQALAEQRARLNERRLGALYELTQMEDRPEDDVLNFVLDSLLNLTSSESGFIFLPEKELTGAGRILWSFDHYRRVPTEHLTGTVFPPDLKALVTNEEGDVVFPYIRNGNGVDPVHMSFDGSMPVMRSMIAAETEHGRPVLVAGVCNKRNDYVEADLKQLQTFINGAWLRFRRRRLVGELRRAKEAAEEANEAKNSFLANISHELRTPLNGMLSMLQLLDEGDLTPEHTEYVKAALFSGNTLVRIISDILDLSRMESGRMQLAPDVFNPKKSLRAALRIFRDEAEQKGLSFTVDIDEAIPDELVGDDARMRQIVFNLVGNALKFTDFGGISVQCSLLRTDEDGNAILYIGVTDTGIGIPAEQQERIFDAFTQVDNSTTRRYPGTGLGLSIVKRLVRLMRGSVTVESEPGRGTTIHCTLTFAAATRAGSAFASAVPSERAKREPLDILVAEDDKVSAFALRSFLKRYGHRVITVPNGRRALEALQLHRFDCLFTDIQMPDMDGLEVVERLRQGRIDDARPTEQTLAHMLEHFPADEVGPVAVNRAMPVVAVSAHAMAGDRERFLRHGITEYISKPIVMEQLDAVLGLLYSQRRQPHNSL